MSTSAPIDGARPLRGTFRVPGDKSISHRALLFNALGRGSAVIRGLLPSADVQATWRCLQQMGVQISRDGDGVVVHGTAGQLKEPSAVLDCGNSGTTMRLLTGVLASQPWFSVLTGDASLRRRPMSRVVNPLREMGANMDGRDNGRFAPLAIRGGGLRSRTIHPAVASAQVKSALLLAGLRGDGIQRVVEPLQSRDHSERMLNAMGAPLRKKGLCVEIEPAVLSCQDIVVPGDISSAAFFLVMAAVIPGSEICIEGVGINPTRSGVLDVLLSMGADITVEHRRQVSGEPVADLVVRSAPLHAVDVEGATIPRLIDEIPVLAVAMACASGVSRIRDAKELRVKESDRIQATAALLRAVGGRVSEHPDGLEIDGGQPLHSATIDAVGDHRIAMAGSAALAVTAEGGEVVGADVVDVSFPGFFPLLQSLQGTP